MTSEAQAAVMARWQTDFPFFAATALKLKTKSGPFAPFALNEAQQHIHACLEAQKAEQGNVRALILKGRQQGASSYVSARFFWRTIMNEGNNTFVITHLTSATQTLFAMVKNYHANLPVKPELAKSNLNELRFEALNSGFKVSTAGSGGTGRGDSFQCFHGSEVAYWPSDDIIDGALQAVPWVDGTEVILESTSAGPQGLFYKMCMDAQAGRGDYRLVFVPWHLQPEYARRAPEGWEPDDEARSYMQAHKLTIEQAYWRNQKLVELGTVAKFRREYPATPEEAFMADVEGALWKRNDIRVLPKIAIPEMKRVVIGLDPATTANRHSDLTGICVVGHGMDDNYYVLRDLSGKYEVEDWARITLDLYAEYNASKIIAETNQGGDMVLSAIRSKDRTANVVGKHVSVAKVKRHEPVSALYRQKRVYHAEGLTPLEDQMCSWNPIIDPKNSPDRLDAMTLAVAELGLTPIRTPFAFVI